MCAGLCTTDLKIMHICAYLCNLLDICHITIFTRLNNFIDFGIFVGIFVQRTQLNDGLNLVVQTMH